MIKLFIDGHSFDKEYQGIRVFIKELYRELSSQTNDIEFYIGAYDTYNLKKEFFFIKNCTFVKYKFSSAFLRLHVDIPLIIKSYNIDFAHFQYVAPVYKLCKYIVTTHDILFKDFKQYFPLSYRIVRNFFFKYSIKNADIKTTVSLYSKQRICLNYSINPKEIFVIPGGISPAFYEPYDKAEATEYIKEIYRIENYILCVSRLEPRKNQYMLLKLFLKEQLYKKGISLVFVGKTSIKNQLLDKMIETMPLEARPYFFIFDQLIDNEIIKLFQASRVFVYPSKAEGFGIPPLEAGALGIPLICSNQTAMEDFTFFNANLFDPNNEIEFTDKLNKLLFHKQREEKYITISMHIKQIYSWKKSASIFLDLIYKN